MDKKELLELKNRLLAFGLAGIIVGTAAGCDKQETNITDSKNETISEFKFNNYIKNSYIVKYNDMYSNEKYIAVHVIQISNYPYYYGNGFAIFDFDNNWLFSSEVAKDLTIETALEEFGYEIGVYITAYDLSKLMVAEYGFKSSYQREEITSLIDKLNNGEIKLEDETGFTSKTLKLTN